MIEFITIKMETLLSLNFNQICRVCLTEREQMHPLFNELYKVSSEANEMLPISKILTHISSMKVQADDGLPSLICAKCVDMAHISFKFQMQCNQAQSILDSYINRYSQRKLIVKNNMLPLYKRKKIASQENFNSSLLVQDTSVVENEPLRSNNDNLLTDFPTFGQLHENFEPADPLDVNSSNVPPYKFIVIESENEKPPNEEKSHACSLCEKSYKYANSLRMHLRNHTQERPYSCKICSKRFKQSTSLMYHTRSHTGEQPYACKICGKRYKQSGTLTAHMRIHTGQKPFLCSICGRGFRQASDLGYHMRFHTKEKPYMCNACGKTMSMQSHLVQHMRTHTGEKPYKCNVCEKAFPSSTRLKRHAIIHTNLKPYTCEVCSKSFNRMSSLKVHSKIHTDERAHICSICGKGFIQAHALKSHLMSHSSEVAYLSPGCSVVA